MGRDDEIAELLLPGAALAARRVQLLGMLEPLRARRAFLSAAQPAQAVEAARALQRIEQDQRSEVLERLLACYLGAALPPEAFAAWRRAPQDAPAAWAALGAAAADSRQGTHVPLPGEAPLAVARRLFGALQRVQRGETPLRLWRVRLVHAEQGAAQAERLLAELLPTGQEARSSAVLAAFLAERVELALSRGAVARARAELERAQGLVARVPALARLWGQALAAAGEWEAARDVAPLDSAVSGFLPVPLARVRTHAPFSAPFLAGRAPPFACAAPRPERGSRARAGAAFLALFALDRADDARALMLDAAPALRARVDGWAAERRFGWNTAGAPERELALDPRPRRWHRPPGARAEGVWRTCLGGVRILALALEPVLDERGELAGWLWLECEHHLLPAVETLGAWARAARDDVLGAARRPPGEPTDLPVTPVALAVAEAGAPGRVSILAAPPVARDPRVFFARAFGAALEFKLTQRRWWLFAREGAGARVLADGGGAFQGAPLCVVASALDRVRRTGAPLLFAEPEPGLAPVAAAASGIVLPFALGGVFLGWFALVSARRRDFGAADCERLGARVRSAAPRMLFATLAARDGSLARGPLVAPQGERAAQNMAAELCAAASASGPLVFIGPPGAGTTTLARWTHALAGASGDEPLFEWGSEGPDGSGAGNAAKGAAVLLERPDRWDAAVQSRAAALLGRAAAHSGAEARPLRATLADTPQRLLLAGALRPELAARLVGHEVFAPGLAADRAELAALIEARIAAEALGRGCRAPLLDDDALALLWRQPFEGNLAELGALARALVARYSGASVDEAAAAALVRGRGGVLVQRFATRGLPRELLVAALEATRTKTGRINKCRAARFLGWDPDTLVLRMSGAGLDGA